MLQAISRAILSQRNVWTAVALPERRRSTQTASCQWAPRSLAPPSASCTMAAWLATKPRGPTPSSKLQLTKPWLTSSNTPLLTIKLPKLPSLILQVPGKLKVLANLERAQLSGPRWVRWVKTLYLANWMPLVTVTILTWVILVSRVQRSLEWSRTNNLPSLLSNNRFRPSSCSQVALMRTSRCSTKELRTKWPASAVSGWGTLSRHRPTTRTRSTERGSAKTHKEQRWRSNHCIFRLRTRRL